MRVRSTDIVAGVPAKEARAIVREIREHDTQGLPVEYLETRVGREVLTRFVDEGFLEPTTPHHADRPACLMTTIRGNALAGASFGPPTPRAKAQRELEAFLDRVREVNANPDLMYWIVHVDLFGSFLDPTIDPVGDIDLAVEFRGRWDPNDHARFRLWSRERVEATGPASLDAMQQTYWPKREVDLRLKNRRPVLSICESDQPQRIGARWERIYEFEPVTPPAGR